MTLSQMFEMAVENKLIDLQALIMFLVFEKKVLTMESDAQELDLYFLKKHRERMNRELHAYKKKMNMKKPSGAYRVITKNVTFYIHAQTREQAGMYVRRLGHDVICTKYIAHDTLMSKGINISDLIKNTTTPSVIGVNTIENLYRSVINE